MSTCTVLFFATLKDRTGTRQVTLEIPDGLTVGGLKTIIRDKFPAITTALAHALIAVNREYAIDDDPIPAEAEIALFPPVSGGSWRLYI